MIDHNIDPVFDGDSRVLVLGSFPSVASRETCFFYGHKQNRFWRVLAHLFDEPTPESIPEKREFLLAHHIAVWDVIASCEITGSADVSIKKASANDISRILENADIKRIFVNGKTAAKLYDKLMFPTVNIEAVTLPSTSPANAACSFEMLCERWSDVAKFCK